MIGRWKRKGIRSGKIGRGKIKRVIACLLSLAIAAAAPGQTYAMEQERVSIKLHHKHAGEAGKGTGCYTKAIYHTHEGNPANGGECYGYPIYHLHTGNAEQGGGCYNEEIYHEHEGNEQEGGSCYETPIYHVHQGSTEEGGVCYQKAVYHEHVGNETEGGDCYQTAVYHKHSGSSGQGGGCYGEPVYHVHTGNAAVKGGCYSQPVYHVHTGSNVTGGGCYSIPVYHSHAGSETSGGECYTPIYHQHTDSCYTEETCTMTYIGAFEILRTEDVYCAHHGVTQFVHFQADFRHESCGGGVTTATHGICWTCGNKNKQHTYNKLTCTKTEATVEGYQLCCGKDANTVDSYKTGCGKSGTTVDSYQIGCGKSQTTIEAYKRNCNKTESTIESYQKSCTKTNEDIDSYALSCEKTKEDIDSYALSCSKDEKTIDAYKRNCEKDETYIDAYALTCQKEESTIDGYELGCGKDEQIVYGEFVLWNDTPKESQETVTLMASYTDKEDFLQLSELSFVWEEIGQEGQTILQTQNGQEKQEGAESATEQKTGSERRAVSSMQVTHNGTYRVYLKTNQQELAEQQPCLTIEVKNIAVAAGTGDDATDDSETQEDTTQEDTTPEDTTQEDTTQEDTTQEDTTQEDDTGDLAGEDQKEVLPVQKTQGEKKKNAQETTASKESNHGETRQKEKKITIKEVSQATQENEKDAEKEEITVASEVLLSEPQQTDQPKQLQKNSVAQTVAKAVAFTMSSVILLAAILYLIYMLLRSVRVYHQDGEGGSDYAGSCMLKKTNEGFELRLPDMLIEQSATGQFELRPGRFFVRRHKGEELLVIAGKRREAVWITGEIQLRIPVHT